MNVRVILTATALLTLTLTAGKGRCYGERVRAGVTVHA